MERFSVFRRFSLTAVVVHWRLKRCLAQGDNLLSSTVKWNLLNRCKVSGCNYMGRAVGQLEFLLTTCPGVLKDTDTLSNSQIQFQIVCSFEGLCKNIEEEHSVCSPAVQTIIRRKKSGKNSKKLQQHSVFAAKCNRDKKCITGSWRR